MRVPHSSIVRTLPFLMAVSLGSLSAQARYGDGTGELDDPYLIYTVEHLNAIDTVGIAGSDRYFKLMADLDLADYPADQFRPINSFRGVFDGNGHTISHFTCTDARHGAGLFDYVRDPNAVIKNLGLIDPDVHTENGTYAGALVGWLRDGHVLNCYVLGGSVSGESCVGGLVGMNYGTIRDCNSTASVSGSSAVGGLVGTNGGSIANCYCTAVVVNYRSSAGGLVGHNGIYLATADVIPGRITDCYSCGTVAGLESVGGLVGYNGDSFIADCYSTMDVSGNARVGGLAGSHNRGSIIRCYATGRVTGDKDAGGLIGLQWGLDTGAGIRPIGASVPTDGRDTVVASFWDVDTSGQSVSAGGTSVTTREMHDPHTFIAAGWHFVGIAADPSDIWAEPSGGGCPILWWQLPEAPALPAFSGGTGDPCDPYLIAAASDLGSIGYNPRLMHSHFKLTNDIDLRGTQFHPIGDRDYPYSGVFSAGGFRISSLTLASAGTSCIGLFASIDGTGAQVKDLNLVDPCVAADGGQCVGALVGELKSGALTNCHAWNVLVRGGDQVGGLVGRSSGTITKCHSVGSVAGHRCVGGLLGTNDSGRPENRAAVTYCYSGGSVSGVRQSTGGLVGLLMGIVANSYSRCDVTGSASVGGLVGRVMSSGSFQRDMIANCYSTGNVNGDSYVGGLLGLGSEGIVWSFWDMQTSGQTASGGGVGLTTAEMQMASTFLEAGWDFVDETENGREDIWWILEGQDYPRLWWESGDEAP